jgi:hypothetical protein
VTDKQKKGNGGREDSKERRDRELIELLNELRVAIPGIQVLFAFLLTMPFTQRFNQVTTLQRTTYFVTFLCTAVASVLLIAPTVLHRLRFREEDKEHLLQTSNRLAIVGTFFLALAITLVVFLIGDVLYGGGWAIASGGFIGLLFLVIWYVFPITRRFADRG